MKSLCCQTITAVFLLILLCGPATGRQQSITMHLPESMLTEILTQILPIQIDQPVEMINGIITVATISNLQLVDNSLSALIGLTGTDLQISTTVAGHQLHLNVGNVIMDFALNAALRYEQTERTLYILPQVTDMDSHGSAQANEIGSLLAGLFDGKEIPVSIDRFEPIVTTAGIKQLSIDPQLADVTIVPQALVLHLQPVVSVIESPSR